MFIALLLASSTHAIVLPGPGHYSTHQPSQGPSFSIATRPQPVLANEQHIAPGPGEYQPMSPGMEGGPSYTIAMRGKAAVLPLSPGPGEQTQSVSALLAQGLVRDVFAGSLCQLCRCD